MPHYWVDPSSAQAQNLSLIPGAPRTSCWIAKSTLDDIYFSCPRSLLTILPFLLLLSFPLALASRILTNGKMPAQQRGSSRGPTSPHEENDWTMCSLHLRRKKPLAIGQATVIIGSWTTTRAAVRSGNIIAHWALIEKGGSRLFENLSVCLCQVPIIEMSFYVTFQPASGLQQTPRLLRMGTFTRG